MALHDDDTNLDAGQASTPPDKVELTERARRLRRQMTFPERQLWSILRARRLGGFRFKRQHVA